MGVGRSQDGSETIGKLPDMTNSDQIIGATGSIGMLALLKVVIHTLINGEGTNTKIITSGLIHRLAEERVYIRIAGDWEIGIQAIMDSIIKMGVVAIGITKKMKIRFTT